MILHSFYYALIEVSKSAAGVALSPATSFTFSGFLKTHNSTFNSFASNRSQKIGQTNSIIFMEAYCAQKCGSGIQP